MRQLIRLTESDLHRIISNTVNRIISEEITYHDGENGARTFKDAKQLKAFIKNKHKGDGIKKNKKKTGDGNLSEEITYHDGENGTRKFKDIKQLKAFIKNKHKGDGIKKNKKKKDDEKLNEEVTVNFRDGRTLTFKDDAEYKKWRKQQQAQKAAERGEAPATKPKTKTVTGMVQPEDPPKTIGKNITKYANVKELKSMSIFCDTMDAQHAFGANKLSKVREFYEKNSDKDYINQYAVGYKDYNTIVKNIALLGKSGEKAVYNLCRDLAENIEKLKEILIKLRGITNYFRTTKFFRDNKDEIIINGRKDGKTLGINQLIIGKDTDIFDAFCEKLDKKARNLYSVANAGPSPLLYKDNGKIW